MGHAVLKVWRSHVQQQVKDRQLEDLPLALLALRALRAWAAAVVLRRHEVELKAQEEKASLRSTSALAMLRNELRAVRWQGHRAAFRLAQQRALLAQLAPLSAWRQLSQEARHATRLRCELESVNLNTVSALGSARAEIKGVRHLARRSAEVAAWRGSLLCLAPVFHAWSRQVHSTMASRRLRPGEVLLNSGQAAKRLQQELQEARARHVEQLSVLEKELAELKKEVSDARTSSAASVRREARVENIARRHELAAKRGEELAALLACMKAWMGEVVLSRSTAALRKEAQERLAESLARQRLESRGALHQAWSDAAQASRRAAALERRLHADRGGAGDIVPYDASRPSTALAIEERLRRSDAAREAHPSSPSTAEVLLVDPARDEIRAAREGRKGLFVAALNQQAKYWQAEAFNAWCRVFLQDRCQKLQALLDMRKKAGAPATPRTTRSRP